MRSFLTLLLMAVISTFSTTQAYEQNDSAADVILQAYDSQIAYWEGSTFEFPTIRLYYTYNNIIGSAEAADDGVYGPGSQYALDFTNRIKDDLQAWQNSAVTMVKVADLVPRLKRNRQAIALQVTVFGE